MLNELPTLYMRNKEMLEETQKLSKEEKSADDDLRAQHEKWSRIPSDKLTEPPWQELGKYRGILESATRADGIIKDTFQQHNHST